MTTSTSIVPPRRVFITGANGFIGRALATRYRHLGAEVCGVDFTADSEWNVVAGDVREPGKWRDQLSGVDLVIHAAAVVSMVAPMRAAWDVNCNGTRRLLTACRDQGVARFVQISSVAAFGFDFPANVDESHPLITNGNSYVDTKITSEHTVLAAHAGGEIHCTIIRPGDVYGPASRAWVVVPLEMMRAGQFLLPDAGQGVFSPVYIDDLVDGIVLAAGKSRGCGPDIHAHLGCRRELRRVLRASLAVARQARLAPHHAEGPGDFAGGSRRRHRAPAWAPDGTGPRLGRAARATRHVQHR